MSGPRVYVCVRDSVWVAPRRPHFFLRYQRISLPLTSIASHVVCLRLCRVTRMAVPRGFHLRPAHVHHSRAQLIQWALPSFAEESGARATDVHIEGVSVSLSLCGVRRCQERSLRIFTSPQRSLQIHLFHESPFTTCVCPSLFGMVSSCGPSVVHARCTLCSITTTTSTHRQREHYRDKTPQESHRTTTRSSTHSEAAHTHTHTHTYIYICLPACALLHLSSLANHPSTSSFFFVLGITAPRCVNAKACRPLWSHPPPLRTRHTQAARTAPTPRTKQAQRTPVTSTTEQQPLPQRLQMLTRFSGVQIGLRRWSAPSTTRRSSCGCR